MLLFLGIDSRFLKKSLYRYQRPFVGLGLWMRPVKDSSDTIESHTYARAPTFRDLGTKGMQQSLNLTPLDTCIHRPSKDALQSASISIREAHGVTLWHYVGLTDPSAPLLPLDHPSISICARIIQCNSTRHESEPDQVHRIERLTEQKIGEDSVPPTKTARRSTISLLTGVALPKKAMPRKSIVYVAARLMYVPLLSSGATRLLTLSVTPWARSEFRRSFPRPSYHCSVQQRK